MIFKFQFNKSAGCEEPIRSRPWGEPVRNNYQWKPEIIKQHEENYFKVKEKNLRYLTSNHLDLPRKTYCACGRLSNDLSVNTQPLSGFCLSQTLEIVSWKNEKQERKKYLTGTFANNHLPDFRQSGKGTRLLDKQSIRTIIIITIMFYL